MKNKNTIIWILSIISIVSTTALITFWIIRPSAPDIRPFNRNLNRQHNTNMHCDQNLMVRLNLDQEQKNEFNKERSLHHTTIKPIFDSLRILRTKLFNELDKENPDSAIINSCISAISDQEKIIQQESVHHILSMKKFLNPTQFDTLISIHSQAMMPVRKGTHNNRQHYK